MHTSPWSTVTHYVVAVHQRTILERIKSTRSYIETHSNSTKRKVQYFPSDNFLLFRQIFPH